jgi:large subunit ribosomal protein L23
MALFGSKKNKEVKREGGVLGVRGPLAGAKSAEGERGASTRQRDPRTQGSDLAQVSSPLSSTSPTIHRGQHRDIIIRPRITEKSGIMSDPQAGESAVYTFEVRKNANKPMIAQAIKALYKVTPMKVRIVNLPAKRVLVRGKRGMSNAVKKAMVYLKKGEKINLS